MSRNDIKSQTPDNAMLAEVRKLKREFDQIKHSQAPTIFESSTGFVQFSIGPISGGVNQRHTLVATLTPPNNQVLFALPEFAVYDTVLDNTSHYPDGTIWANSNKALMNLLDLNWWYSWSQTNDKNLVAVVDIARQDYGNIYGAPIDNNADGVTSAKTLNITIFLRFRFILPGAS